MTETSDAKNPIRKSPQYPDSLKRGVLSEDGIYNVLERFNDLKRDQNSD
ncbi:MAG: DUF4298 domain-containing protein [Pseudobutyrivibrio sp.]|nr:DUF4298 domain-containing protein [Pseudobutyrivibrio sp.]